MHRLLLPLVVLLAGLLFVGCANAKYLGYEIPDPNQPELIVESQVTGLSHVQHDCIVIAATSEWVGESQAFMDESAPEPQVIRTALRNWRKNPQDKPWLQNIAPGALTFHFILRGAHDYFRAERPTVEAPPRWDPIALLKNPRPKPTPAVAPPTGGGETTPPTGGETTTEDVLGGRAKALSQDEKRPTKIKFRDGRARIECGVSRNSGPQFAQLDVGSETILVKLAVQSHQTTGSATWWSVEVVDKDGESLEPQQQELGFLDPGASVEKEVVWQVSGNAKTLKINSGSEAGDTLVISITQRRGR